MSTSLHDLRPDELRGRVAARPLILVPIGTLEWHAAHLPLGVDGLLSQAVCHELAEAAGCLTAPPIWFGVCRDLAPEAGYYGTVATISEETLERLAADLLDGLARLGFRIAVLVSGHYEVEHHAALQRAIERTSGLQAHFTTSLHLLADQVQPQADLEATWPFAGDHAAECETSLMLHYFPALVDMARAPETIELTMPGLPPYLHRRFPRRASAEYGARLGQAIRAAGRRYLEALLAGLPA